MQLEKGKEMHLDPTQLLLDLDDEPIMVDQSYDLDPTGKVLVVDGKPKMKGGKELTLGAAVVTLALAQFEGEEKMSADKKMDRMELAEKFHKAILPVEITREELSEVLKLAEKGYGIVIFARIKRILVKAEAAKQELRAVN